MTALTMTELLKPKRPSCLVAALKELEGSLPKPGENQMWAKAPPWYMPDPSVTASQPFRDILLDCIKEIEMHQKLNGELYKKLYG